MTNDAKMPCQDAVGCVRLREINAELTIALSDLLKVCDDELDRARVPEMRVARAALAKARHDHD